MVHTQQPDAPEVRRNLRLEQHSPSCSLFAGLLRFQGSSECAAWGGGGAEGKGGGGRGGTPTALELHYLSELRHFIQEKGDCHAPSPLVQRAAARRREKCAGKRRHEWRPLQQKVLCLKLSLDVSWGRCRWLCIRTFFQACPAKLPKP